MLAAVTSPWPSARTATTTTTVWVTAGAVTSVGAAGRVSLVEGPQSSGRARIRCVAITPEPAEDIREVANLDYELMTDLRRNSLAELESPRTEPPDRATREHIDVRTRLVSDVVVLPSVQISGEGRRQSDLPRRVIMDARSEGSVIRSQPDDEDASQRRDLSGVDGMKSRGRVGVARWSIASESRSRAAWGRVAHTEVSPELCREPFCEFGAPRVCDLPQLGIKYDISDLVDGVSQDLLQSGEIVLEIA